MGSPLSGVVAELYLKYFAKIWIGHWLENGEILYYRIYVDDILIIFHQNKTNEDTISKHMNNVHTYLEFKLTEKEIMMVNYLDVSIYRLFRIYRKPIQTDTTVSFISKHPLEH
jgi:hypothetical protein